MARGKCGKCKTQPPTIRPMWADPALTMRTTAFRTTTVTIASTPGFQLAPADPSRVAIAFVSPPTMSTQVDVSPWVDAGSFPLQQISPRVWTWYTLFTHGAMVPLAWYSQGGVGVSIRVVELYILPGR